VSFLDSASETNLWVMGRTDSTGEASDSSASVRTQNQM
jgi:hypothetical protein